MSHGDVTPERLDAILDGREPAETDAEREMLAVAASMKEASPGASDALRQRMRALPPPRSRRSRLGRFVPAGWRGRALVASPALAAVIAAVVAVGVLRDGKGGSGAAGGGDAAVSQSARDQFQAAEKSPGPVAPGASPSSSSGTTAAPLSAAPPVAPPPPSVITVPRGRLKASLETARSLVTVAGGRLVSEPDASGAIRLTITFPPGRGADVPDELAALGETAAGLTLDANGRRVVLLAEAP
jgi:hypothetical protein